MYLSSTAASRLDRRGVALPIALLGLVMVSLMVTAALLTSSTEMALSNVHSDGTRSLYHSDAALEGFVAERAQRVASGQVGLRPDTAYSYTLPGAGAFTIDVSRLSHRQESPSATQRRRTEVFSLLAIPPRDRGRRVGAFVRTTKEWIIIDNNINEGVATGGAIVNSGNSKISANSSICQNPAGSNTAVRFTSDVSQSDKDKLDLSKIEGDTATLTSVSSADLIRHALGGATREDIKRSASIKFGYHGFPSYDESRKPNSTLPDTSRYHWGCPHRVVTCDSPSDTLKVPSIAIDAGGKTIGLQGDHGQGILYVFNGNLKITGQFVFSGAIIIDGGSFEIAGTGTDGTKIEGSLLATQGVKDSRISGNAMVNYNSCAITTAQNAFNQNAETNAPQVLDPATYAWYEVLR